MVKKNLKEIKSVVRGYRNYLTENKIPVSRVLLFGSYVKGNSHRWSDIDVAVITKRFKKYRFDEDVVLNKMALKIDDRIESHGIREKELISPVDTFAKEVAKYGIEV